MTSVLRIGKYGGVRVEVDASLLRMGSPANRVGVACYLADKVYIFVVSSDGSYAIIRDPGPNGALVTLTGGVDFSWVKGLRKTNWIAGECVGGGRKTALLTLYANGKWIDQVSDQGGVEGFDTIGLVADAEKGQVLASFGNVAVAVR